jgi:hypothetical protein
VGESQYITFAQFEEALSDYFQGDTTLMKQAVKLAADVSWHRENIYFPKNWNLGTKKDTPYQRFRVGLVDLGQEALVIFLCERFAGKRLKVPKSAVSVKDRITMTPADDVRLTNQLEQQLMSSVGKEDFDVARGELIRLYEHLPEDGSGQMRKQAMDLVIIDVQISQINRIINSYLYDPSGQLIRRTDGSSPTLPKNVWDQLKDLRNSRDKLMKALGLTAEAIEKRRADGNQGLYKAAEALAERLDETLPTASLIADARELLEGAQEDYGIPEESGDIPDDDMMDEIDMALIHEPAPDA